MSRICWISSMNQIVYFNIVYLGLFLSFITTSTEWPIVSYPTCIRQKRNKQYKELLIHATKYANEIDSKYISNVSLLLPSDSPYPYILRWCTLIHLYFPIAKWAFTAPVRLDVSSVVTLRFHGIGGKGCGEDPTTEDEPSFKVPLRDRCQRGFKTLSFSPWASFVEVRLIRASTAAAANQIIVNHVCIGHHIANLAVLFSMSLQNIFISTTKNDPCNTARLV